MAGKVMAMTFADLVASNAALSGEVRRSHEALKIAQLTIDKMKVELAYLRRMKYGRSSERLEHSQLELIGGQVAQPAVDSPVDVGADDGLNSNVTSLDTVSTSTVGSSKLDAGATRAESCGISTSSNIACPEHWRTRAWCGSVSCSKSRQK